MVLLPVCRIFLSFRCCCPVKLFWIPKYQGRIPCSLFSPFRYFCDAENQIAMSKGARACIYYSKFENFYPRWDIHVTKMKQDHVHDVISDMMTMPPEGLMEESVRVEYSFRKTKTSDFFDENIRTFEAKHPYFCPKKSDVLHLPDRYIAFSLPPLYKKSLVLRQFGW